MTFALITPRDVAITTEVAMIVGGLWIALFTDKVRREVLALDQQLTIQPSSGSRSPGKP
jgi:hypothetical protein